MFIMCIITRLYYTDWCLFPVTQCIWEALRRLRTPKITRLPKHRVGWNVPSPAFALTSAFPFSTKSFTHAYASRGGLFFCTCNHSNHKHDITPAFGPVFCWSFILRTENHKNTSKSQRFCDVKSEDISNPFSNGLIIHVHHFLEIISTSNGFLVDVKQNTQHVVSKKILRT